MESVALRKYEAMSPFEVKDELIKIALRRASKADLSFLNAGRGNPNWVAVKPREAFFLLGQFGLSECTRTMSLPQGVGGVPQRLGIAGRLEDWLANRPESTGAAVLAAMVRFAIAKFRFEADAFVHELVDGVVGDNYPMPSRMLFHNERIVHEYLMWAMCGEPRPQGTFDLYAVEGGTAAMCYLFKSLKTARLLNPGDTIALCVPIFTPYLEMPLLEDYGLQVLNIRSEREDAYQLSHADFQKLEDPKVKAFFLVNPGNPTGVALDAEAIGILTELVTTKRPDLMILTDDVYGTFVPGFRSLLGALPRNTIGVYSYSKYFGCTGWRLGVIALHQDNIFDAKIAVLPEPTRKRLDERYSTLALNPRDMKFIDRIVADSRDVALNHTAGLSLPQQVMMTLFSLSELMDEAKEYQQVCIETLRRRFRLAVDSLGLDIQPWPTYDAYYGLFDLEYWLKNNVSPEVLDYVRKNVHPLDMVFRLAEEHGVVLLNGGGFAAPNWSVRASFANLHDEAYSNIGRAIRAVVSSYVREFEAAKRAKSRSRSPAS